MKVIIAGSRDITDMPPVENAIGHSGFHITEVVSGCARGPDTLGKIWAARYSIPVKLMPADWKYYGKGAGAMRNTAMAHYADALIAVWDGASRGTGHMIDVMHKLGKPVYVYHWGQGNA